MRTALFPKWFFDGHSQKVQENKVVLLEGNRICDVISTQDYQTRPTDRQVNLSNQTILPGLINHHVHSVMPGDKSPFVMAQLDTETTMALRAVTNIRTALQSGVTYVRDCGGKGTVTTELRDAQKANKVRGSRMFCSGWPITISGGHVRYYGGEADGKVELLKMVRRLVGIGVDFIKVMESGGGTPGSLSHYPAYTEEELSYLVQISHDFDKLVSAHCIATKSIEQAIDAGVDLIEHALFIDSSQQMIFDERVAAKLAKSGIPVTTTLCPFSDALDHSQPGDPDFSRRQNMLRRQYEFFEKMKDAGVRLIAGSDAGWLASPFNGFWKELFELTNCGFSTLEAVIAGTKLPADAMGISDDFGTIAAGKVGDIVVVNGNLSEDIMLIRQIHSVYQNGELVVSAKGDGTLKPM